MTKFTVDVEDLQRVKREMLTTHQRLQTLAADLEKQMATLHDTWEGEAAEAQKLAQAEWRKGFALMRDALEELHLVATTAHTNYTASADANLAMWNQLR
jgi:WXG100 family type VII secretion target